MDLIIAIIVMCILLFGFSRFCAYVFNNNNKEDVMERRVKINGVGVKVEKKEMVINGSAISECTAHVQIIKNNGGYSLTISIPFKTEDQALYVFKDLDMEEEP